MAIELIAKVKPKNGGTFAMVDAEDVEMPDGTRLSEYEGSMPAPGTAEVGQFLRVLSVDENKKITEVEAVTLISHLVPVTQAKYDELIASGGVHQETMYVIVGEPV